jgi:hypothetical protein
MCSVKPLVGSNYRSRPIRGHLPGISTLHLAKEELVSTLIEFQKAQCYFTIPLMIAALSSGLFSLDFLSSYALLPVTVNAFLPPVFTLILVHRYATRSWYLLGLLSPAGFSAPSFFGLWKRRSSQETCMREAYYQNSNRAAKAPPSPFAALETRAVPTVPPMTLPSTVPSPHGPFAVSS